MDEINKKRIRRIFAFFSVIMAVLVMRLIYIQAACHDEFEAAAVSQYEIVIEGLDTRGMILDRNLMPLTGGTKQYYYIIGKSKADYELERIMEDIEGRQIAKKTSAYLVYRTEVFDEEINEELKEEYQAYVFETSARYSDDQTACHLIGYLNQDEKTGVSGIELLCQDRLESDEDRLTVWADAAGNILRGIAPTVRSQESGKAGMEERSIITTLDRRIQYICERALKEKTKSGAAVVMDAETGEILAWASAPAFNPNNIEEYLSDEGDCLINKVCQGAYAPGSIFKIVTAAAALESGKCTAEQEFECTGEVTVEGVTLGCTAAPEGGHGVLDMKGAMAVSCNCYFAQLGDMIGSQAIVREASKFGLGEKTLEDFPEETAGNLPDEAQVGPWDVSNLSIGQGQILATPLQMARMTAAVSNGGTLVEPKIFLKDRDNRRQERIIDEETAGEIREMLKCVMSDGTAKGQWSLPVWGKTGTAEAGSDGKETKNCWFTGCCQVSGKTYVITVMTEDGTSGASSALPVFKDITEFLKQSSQKD